MTVIRAAMTQTINVYPHMPDSVDGLSGLIGHLGAIRDANLRHHIGLINAAADAGAQIIGLGELFGAPYFALERREMWLSFAEDAFEGPTASAMSSVAADLGIVVVAPIYELDRSTGRRFNTAIVIDSDGAILGRYRKVHIPHGSNEQGSFDELFYYEPGDVPQNAPSESVLGVNPYFPVFRASVCNVGVAICYDRHFDYVTRELSQAGAQIVFSPAVTFGKKSRRMWDVEFETDAARHNIYIGGSNRLGAEKPWNQEYFGESYFVGPAGRVENISRHGELVISDLDMDRLDSEDPSGWNLRRDARPEICRYPAGPGGADSMQA